MMTYIMFSYIKRCFKVTHIFPDAFMYVSSQYWRSVILSLLRD